MQDEQAFLHKVLQWGTMIANTARKNQNILLVGHHDADGICSAALLSRFIFRNGGHCQVKSFSEPNSRHLEKIARGKFDSTIFLDLASGLSSEIEKYLGDKWLIIDHHSIPDEEIRGEQSKRILNPWQFGIDGSTEIACAGIIHFLTEKTREPVSPFLAAVGALGDGQDVGPRRSLTGLNSKILDSEVKLNNIDTKVDLLFYGRATKPMHEAVASTVTCYIPGLTGNKDACLASLRGAGIELKLNSRWKTMGDLGEEEKQQIISAILPHLSGTTSSVEDLVGTIYCLNSVDEYSPMHDARDFASLLSAYGRMGKSGLAISLCLEIAAELPTELEKILAEYLSELVRGVQTLVANADRNLERSQYSLIVGDGILAERMTGAICQVLAALNRSKNKIVFLRTTTQDGDVKVSARLGKGYECDLGSIMRSVARATSGVGGGHPNKGGARFSIARQQEFQVAVEAQFQSQRPK